MQRTAVAATGMAGNAGLHPLEEAWPPGHGLQHAASLQPQPGYLQPHMPPGQAALQSHRPAHLKLHLPADPGALPPHLASGQAARVLGSDRASSLRPASSAMPPTGRRPHNVRLLHPNPRLSHPAMTVAGPDHRGVVSLMHACRLTAAPSVSL